MKKKIDVSMVVATHKGINKLPLLVSSLKKNSILPKEIIICGTNLNDIKLLSRSDIKSLNIRFFISKIKNQIFQRKLALKKITQAFILQLDDDIVIESNFFENLYFHIKKNDKKKIIMSLVVIPGLKEQAYRWNLYFRSNLYFRIILKLFNYGKKIKYMSILQSGRICPLLPKNFINKKKTLKNLEWTNSLICYHKSALNYSTINYEIKKNEKSYYEDVIFSHNLYLRGFKLQLDPKLKAIHPYFNKLDLQTHLKTIKTQYFIVKKFNKSYLLFILDAMLATIFLIFR